MAKPHATKKRSAKRMAYGDIAAVALAAAWFLYNALLPDMYRGRVCCDSIGYIDIAKGIHSFQDAFFSYGWRTNGYPLFLKLHELLVGDALEPLADFVDASLLSAFLLHVGACFFFFRSLRGAGFAVPRALLWLLLVHPGLVSHTALPLTDGAVTTTVMFAAGAALRMLSAKHSRSALAGWSALAGALFAWAVFIRPSHLPAAAVTVLFLAAVVAWRAIRSKKTALACLTLLCPLLFALVLLPRTVACMRIEHRTCLLTTGDRDNFLRMGIDAQRVGARTYTTGWDDAQGVRHDFFTRTVPDQFFVRQFDCMERGEPPIGRVLRCYAQRISSLPFIFFKKTVALFDNFQLNTYATWITVGWHIAFNRLFGVLGFVGFGSLLLYLGDALVGKRFEPRLALFVYPVVYWLTSLIPSTDARYGFPLVPFAFAGFFLAFGSLRTRNRRALLYVACAVLATAFLFQVTEWDLSDPLVLGPAS